MAGIIKSIGKFLCGCHKELEAENLSLLKELAKTRQTNEFEKYLDENYSTTNLIYTKRWVLDKKENMVPLDVRDYLRCDFFNTLPKIGSLKEIYEVNVDYVTDDFSYKGMLDVWQFASETHVLKKGDCDDSTIYRNCLAYKLGNSNVVSALGFYDKGGHAFNLLYENGDISILEPTSNQYGPLKISSLENTGTPYKINYVFNPNKTWVVDGSAQFGDKVKKEFDLKEGL